MPHYDEARGLLNQQITTVASQVAAATHAAASKATPVDADELPLVDSAASFGLKRLTWANLKATLKTYFDTLYQVAATYVTPTTLNNSTLSASVTTLSVSSDLTNLKTIGYAASANLSSYLGTVDNGAVDNGSICQWRNFVSGDNTGQNLALQFFPCAGAWTTAMSFNASGITMRNPITVGYTVATLPAGSVGMRAHVTDASAPAFGSAVVGGGAVRIPVFHNGTTWIVG